MSSTEKKMITLRSSDMEVLDVEEEVALQSETIKHMMEVNCADNCIPLPNVTSKMLSKVIEYCKKHVDSAAATINDDLKSFDADFVKLDQATLFQLIMAANFLNIKSLLDLTCQAAADMIKDKTPEEVREIFNIENDFTAEGEAEIRKEHQWAHE